MFPDDAPPALSKSFVASAMAREMSWDWEPPPLPPPLPPPVNFFKTWTKMYQYLVVDAKMTASVMSVRMKLRTCIAAALPMEVALMPEGPLPP